MDRKRILIGTVIGVLGLVLVIVGGGYLLLTSQGFGRYAIGKIVAATNEATGGRTEIKSFDFRPSTLTATLNGVTVHGTEASGDPPLLQLDKLTVRLKIQSLLHRKLTLQELLIEHPVAHLRVNAQGQSNLPRPKPTTSSSQTSVFDLAVGHALLTNGEVYVDDRAVPVNADLYGLNVDFRFDPASTRYVGDIAYDHGRVGYLQYPALAHSLNAKLNFSPTVFALESAVLRVGGSTASLHGTIADYNHPQVDAQYDVRIHADDLRTMAPQTAPSGDIVTSGSVRYQPSDQPLLRNVVLRGSISSAGLSAAVSQGRLEMRSLTGNYALENGVLQTSGLSAQTLGGRLDAEIYADHLDTQPAYRLRAAIHDFSMQAAQRTFHAQTGQIVLLGRVDGTVEATSRGNLSNTTAHALLRLRNEMRSTTSDQASIPINGVVNASYEGSRQAIVVRQSTLSAPSTTLTAQGELSRGSNLQISVRADDLKQLAMLASTFRSSDQAKLPEIAGSAVLNAVVRGSMQQPQLAGTLDAQNLQVQGSEWSRASVGFRANPSQFALNDGNLTNAHQGKASFSGSVGLRHWSYSDSNPISAKLSVQQLSITDLQRLAALHYPVEGDLSGDVSVQGSQLDPNGSGTLRITNARAYGEPIDKLTLDFHGAQGTVHSRLNVAGNPGVLNAQLSYVPKTKSYTFQMDAPSLALQKLKTVQAKNIGLAGVVSATGNGKGTIDDPQLTANLQVTKLQLKQRSYSDIKADLRVEQHRAEITVHSEVERALIQAHGTMNLNGDQQMQLQVDTGTVNLGPLLTSYMASVPDDFDGQVEVHATLKGPLKDKSRMEGSLTVPVFRAHYQSLQVGASRPIQAHYSRSVLTVLPTEIQGTGTSLQIQGNLPLEGSNPATLTAKGTLDAQLLRLVQPDLRSSGTVLLDVHASGSGKSWGTQGQVRLQNIGISNPEGPIGVEKLNGVLDITGNKVQVSHVSAQVGGGEVNLGGSVTYRPNTEFNLAAQAKTVRLRYPEGVRTVLGGNVNLVGTTQSASLNGKVLVESLSFTPDFDLAKFGDQFEGSVPAQPGIADNIKLHIVIQSTGQLSATSSQVSLEGRLNLQAIGTAANPVIIGRTDLTGGELFYRNVRYQLQRGIITFDNPNQTNPVMNVAVATTVQQYNLTLTLRGPLDKLTTSYVSDPPLATADIINLLARGRTTQETDAAAQGTDALIASQAAGRVSSSVQKMAGISSLQIDPLIGGNNRNPSARIALQQRVTKNFLFTFSTDVSEPGSEIVQGDYQITKRWSVSVARDQAGGVSVDGKYHTKF
jgi:translocation and assembly module TamB